MKTNAKLSILSIAGVLSASALLIAISQPAPPAKLEELLVVEPPVVATVTAVPDYIYIAKEWQGYIGIFTNDAPDTPKYVTDIDTSTLTNHDLASLKQGIKLKTETDLRQLIEDFGS